MPMSLTAAFAAYGARLENTRWAFSATIADDGSLVLSCWKHLMKSYVDGHKRYEDDLSRFIGSHQGRHLVSEHLKMALRDNLPVRLVMATLADPTQNTDGDASGLEKTFSIHPDLVGRVVRFEHDIVAIEFRREETRGQA